ncbi:MAG TPA: sensor histidine kinase [Ktedonosporobacter sp.]|nr:sensor histidine kinase [Ktedonosporobacter sp.]
MDSTQWKTTHLQASWDRLYSVVRTIVIGLYTRVRNSILQSGWVVLGLGLIALLVQVLAMLPGWFGPILFGTKRDVMIIANMSTTKQLSLDPPPLDVLVSGSLKTVHYTTPYADTFLPTLLLVPTTILLYAILTSIQPRLFAWPKRQAAYLLILGTTLLALTFVPQLLKASLWLDQFALSILSYALIAHARVTFDKKTGWLVEGMTLAAVLTGIAIESVSEANQLLLHMPILNIDIGITIQAFQSLLWLLGLLCLHIFTGIGVHERTARQQSERLVKELTAAQEQLRAYTLHAEEFATMRERSRVAREVHDTLAQGLAAIKMHLETGARVFHEQPALAYQHLERASTLAGEHLNETRNSILNLRTDALAGRTLPNALTLLVAAWSQDSSHHQAEATFCVSGIAKDAPFWETIPPSVGLACYRIVQETLSNASKHGQAEHIDVELSIEQNELCLTITDDGVGFDLATISLGNKERGGFGIIGMHERLKLLGGRLDIISTLGSGTQVVTMIPLRRESKTGIREQNIDTHIARR